MKTIRIGIMSQEEYRERTLAIARGEYSPKPGEPKIWFPSMKSLSEVLSDNNRELLRIIQERHPESISELARLTGRKQGNLSRTLKTMERYGFVVLKRHNRCVKPEAMATRFLIQAT